MRPRRTSRLSRGGLPRSPTISPTSRFLPARADATRCLAACHRLTKHRASSSALVQTPGRSLSQVASRIPLPATPADIAHSVDRSALAVRQRVTSLYQESGITDVTNVTRTALSTVHSIVTAIALLELYFIRPEVLSDRFAFTIPAVSVLGTSDYPVYLPDLFLLLTWSFWSPALTWFFTSFLAPAAAGYFFNLGAHASSGAPRTRARAQMSEYAVDPLIFSIAKALIAFVVYGQGVTFGILNDRSIERIDSALYGGYKGVLTGAAISGLASLYDAVLRK